MLSDHERLASREGPRSTRPDGGEVLDRFAPLLDGLDAEDLARVAVPTCGVFADMTIGYVNAAWVAFARANGAAEVWGPGDRMVNAISPPLDRYYAERLARVCADGQPWEHDYECSSPTLFRLFRLRAVAIAGGAGLLISHALRVERPHAAGGVADDSNYRAANRLVTQCAHCRRIERPSSPGQWDWVPALLADPPTSLSHGLCEACSASYFEPSARVR